MPQIECSKPNKSGSKVCKVTRGTDRGRTFHVRAKASAGTIAKRKRAASTRLKKFRFKASDARGCPVKSKTARGKCIARKMLARVR